MLNLTLKLNPKHNPKSQNKLFRLQQPSRKIKHFGIKVKSSSKLTLCCVLASQISVGPLIIVIVQCIQTISSYNMQRQLVIDLFQAVSQIKHNYTLRTNGALKDLIGSFTLSQIQDPIWFFRGPIPRVPRRTPLLWCSEAPAPPICCFETPCNHF